MSLRRLARAEALELDDPGRRPPRRGRYRRVGGHNAQRATACLDDLAEIPVVVVLGVVLVVVRVRRRGVQRDEQRLVQPPRVGCRVGAGLLGEQIEVVVGRLKRDHGTEHQIAV